MDDAREGQAAARGVRRRLQHPPTLTSVEAPFKPLSSLGQPSSSNSRPKQLVIKPTPEIPVPKSWSKKSPFNNRQISFGM
jgi:hypothetical protein